MNYSLGFPDLSQELSISPKQSLEAVVSYFRSKHLEPDSAVRAIHHQPAAEGDLRRYSRARRPRTPRRAREARHRAPLHPPGRRLRPDSGRQARRHRHPHRQRQDALLQPARAQSPAARPRRARHVPVPHQGPRRRSASRVPDRRGGNGQRDPRLHLRWRYPAGRPQAPSASAPTSSSPIPTCCTPASCRTTPTGRAISRTCATS